MATATTVRLDIRQSLLATVVALADGQAWLVKTRPGSADAAAARLVAAELALIDLANVQLANADKRGGSPSERDALLVLKVDIRDVEAFSGEWLDAAAPSGSHTPAWRLAHLINALDFGRWLIALSATALAAKQGANADLQADAIRAILQLDMALTEVTQTCLGRRAECIVAWTM